MSAYSELTIHQKISLKEMICSRKARNTIFGKHDDMPFVALKAIKSFTTWETVINYYLLDDINILYNAMMYYKGF